MTMTFAERERQHEHDDCAYCEAGIGEYDHQPETADTDPGTQ